MIEERAHEEEQAKLEQKMGNFRWSSCPDAEFDLPVLMGTCQSTHAHIHTPWLPKPLNSQTSRQRC